MLAGGLGALEAVEATGQDRGRRAIAMAAATAEGEGEDGGAAGKLVFCRSCVATTASSGKTLDRRGYRWP